MMDQYFVIGNYRHRMRYQPRVSVRVRGVPWWRCFFWRRWRRKGQEAINTVA